MALVSSTSTGVIRDCRQPEFTITTYVEGLALASNEAGAANIAKVLTTLISQLINAGIISGTVNS